MVEPSRKPAFRFGIRTVLFLTAFVAALITLIPIATTMTYRFESWDSYAVSKTNRVCFQGNDVELCVILEEGKTAPTLRQKLLIYRLQRYGAKLKSAMDYAVDQHRIYYEQAVGDLVEEYGLPVMNLENISGYYEVGLIWVPRLEGSSDDYLVLGCGCEWENEHGMELLVKNGQSVPWHGTDGPWQWEIPWEFLDRLEKTGTQ